MNYSRLYSTICMLSLLSSCSTTNQTSTDYSNIELTIERGAFHYDKFVLKDTTITFYPSKDSFGSENINYNQVSKHKISKDTRDQFLTKIIQDGIFNLKSNYSSNTTCNSSLSLNLKIDNKQIKITSDDYKRGCPPLLIYIEETMVQLHNKNLERILLPG